MPETKWTDAQRAAIDDRGGTLLLSAAAGSGKTAVLTERAVQLILDEQHPAEADRLLILTFTNAAAAELRARIGARLAAAVRQDPGNVRLRRQRVLLQRAPICTVDAFCLDLLRRHFSALDIPADFSAADAGSLQALRTAALAETMEQASTNADFCAFADLYGRGRSDAAAEETVLRLYDFLQSLPDPDAALTAYLTPWNQPGSFAASLWAPVLYARAGREAAAAAQGMRAAYLLCQSDLELARAAAEAARKTPAARAAAVAKANARYAEPLGRLEDAASQCEALAAQAAVPWSAAQGEALWTALETMIAPCRRGEAPMPGLKGMKGRLSGDSKAVVRALADTAADHFAELCTVLPCSLAEAEADRAAAMPLLNALGAAVRDFSARYYARKLEKKLLDFSDFEHLALRLLRAPDGARTPLGAAISAGYDAVMVDEYQDTNALQDALYRCLARPAGDNLFLVGDLKQSIYRFRQADPSIFLTWQDRYAPLPRAAARPYPPAGVPGKPARLPLDTNFRSAPAVVDAVNYLFETLMSRELGGIEYGPGQRLVCGAAGPYPGRAEAVLYRAKGRFADAPFVAQRIRELLAQQTPVRSGGGTRALRPEDCCILLSTRAGFAEYEAALEALGIPAYADAADDLLAAPHLQPLLSLLRVLDNPAQSIELAAAMRSPLFGFDDDDLLRLRAGCKKTSLYGALVHAAAGQEGELSARARQFCAELARLRRLSRTLPVEQLLEEIFVSTGFLAALGAAENGVRRREEARRFAAWAAGAGAGGLGSLIRAIDATEEAGGLTDSAPGQSKPGCVSIMTIHRSKGLQFPAVFAADLDHLFNFEDLAKPVLFHRELGIGLSLREGQNRYSTAARTALRIQSRTDTLSEQMRLLYVAVTRAQDLLSVTLTAEDPAVTIAKKAALLQAGPLENQLRAARCFSDWLLPALLLHPDGGALRAAAGPDALQAVHVRPAAGHIDISLRDPDAEEAAPEAAAPAGAGADPQLVQAVQQGFAWRYPALAETEIPAKVSVTSIVHRSEHTLLERPGFLSAGGLSAAEMGTALHAFLEHAELAPLAAARAQGSEALRAALEAERQRQLALRLTDSETAARLDLARLETFVCGEAFTRMAAAKRVLREYAFITSVPAAAVLAAQGAAGTPAPEASVLVQGIADVVLVFDDHLELLDYKTDRRKTPEQYLQAYREQLALYAAAIEKRFAPRKVTYRGIYSFDLGVLIPA